jgi:hypothetical protein
MPPQLREFLVWPTGWPGAWDWPRQGPLALEWRESWQLQAFEERLVWQRGPQAAPGEQQPVVAQLSREEASRSSFLRSPQETQS